MIERLNVTATCNACGSRFTWPDDAVDSTELSCKNCGKHVGTYGDFKAKARDFAQTHLQGLLKDAVKF